MNDNYIEAMTSIHNDEWQGDRERAYEKEEAQHDVHEPDTFERLTIGDKLDVIVEEAKKLGDLIDEQNHKFYWDAKHGF